MAKHTKSTSPPTDAERRDARIVSAGLLNNIIAAGYEPEDWARMGLHALNVHQYMTRKALRLKAKVPNYKGEETNG
jgi:hypothetical protein